MRTKGSPPAPRAPRRPGKGRARQHGGLESPPAPPADRPVPPPTGGPRTDRPLASIIIVSYNSRADLAPCLDAVLRTVDAACEVIVVDNASMDGSADFVAGSYPTVTLIRSPANTGFAAGTNRGAGRATGEYVVGLNPDTVVTSGWLAALLAPLAAPAPPGLRPGLTTPRILQRAAPDRVNACGNRVHYTGLTVCRGLDLPAGAPEVAQPCVVGAVSGACFALPRALWTALGGLDATFFTYLEDTDLSLRARLAGYTCLYVPDAVVYHHYTRTVAANKLYYLVRNRLLMLYKCYRGPTLVGLLPALLLAEGLTWGYAVTRGRAGLGATLRAYGWLWAHRAEVREQRQQTQELRRVDDPQLLAALAWSLDISQLAGPALGRLAGRLLNPVFRFWYHALPGPRAAAPALARPDQ